MHDPDLSPEAEARIERLRQEYLASIVRTERAMKAHGPRGPWTWRNAWGRIKAIAKSEAFPD